MNMKPMNSVPKSRKEFERNFHLLEERMRNGQMYFSPQTKKMTNDLLKIRRLPNRRLDFLTINEGARLTANMMANYDDMPSKFAEKDETDK